MTQMITKERREVVRVESRGICSVCDSDLLPGQAVLLDAKPYDTAKVGDDWTWSHEACGIVQARPSSHK
jgi:hypothetical protein